MNEQENTRIVQSMYDAFKRGDIAGVLRHVADNVVWTVPGPKHIPYAGQHRGMAAVKKFFDSVGATSDFSLFEPQQFIAQGDTVITLGRYKGTAKPTGREFGSEFAMMFRLSNRKVTEFREYMDTADLAAAHAPARAGAGS